MNDDLYTVELWKPDPDNIMGKWVYTVKSNVYSIVKEHYDFMKSMGYKVRLTPELN